MEHIKSSSLFTYALRIAIPVGVAVLFALWLIQNHLIQSTVEVELREHIKNVGARETAQIQSNLDGLQSYARALAANDLIVNGLIDVEGRDTYIPVFFHSLIAPLAPEASVSLLDYKGRGIASSARDNAMPPVSPEMIKDGAFFIDSHRLLIVEPVLISGSAEGAIVLNYSSSTYDEIFGGPASPHGLFVEGFNGLVVYSTNSNLATVGDLNMETSKQDWLHVRDSIANSNLAVIVGSSLEVALQSMETIQFLQIAGLVVLLLVTVSLLLFSVFIVSRPLKQFTANISAIQRMSDLNKHLDTKGPREIAKIASTFNRMTDWLMSTTVSRDYMDNILESINEGIVTIDNKGLITTFNAGATEIFGYDISEVIGRNVSMLLPSDERENHDGYLLKTDLHLPRIIAKNRELQGCRKNGTAFPLELVVSPLTEENMPHGFVATIRDITERKIIEERLEQRSQELKRINKELEQMALNDSLTGLGNRNLFTDRLNNLLATCKRNQSHFSLLMMDLNKFKHINDTYGHEAGDAVLREVGKRLKALGRDVDSFFRLGGDEFAALISTGVTRKGMEFLANRIIHAFEAPIEYHSEQLKVGISIGIVLFPEHSEDEEELQRLADAAMYEAKRGQLGYTIACTPEELRRSTN